MKLTKISERVLFLGDCPYPSPEDVMTSALALPLCQAVLALDAEPYEDTEYVLKAFDTA